MTGGKQEISLRRHKMKYLTTNAYRPVSLVNDMDRLFDQFFETAKAPASRAFAVDIAENEDGYRIEADLPGYSAADVDIRVEDNLLVIEAKALENTEEKKEEERTWRVRERSRCDLKRSFVLPEDVEKEAVEAEMKNGVLFVTLKKRPEAKPFSVKVQGK
jgi:HSP20 family protein